MLLFLFTSFQFGKKDVKYGFINTVNGKVEVDSLNFSLTYEHVMSNFMAEPCYVGEYDVVALFDQVMVKNPKEAFKIRVRTNKSDLEQ